MLINSIERNREGCEHSRRWSDRGRNVVNGQRLRTIGINNRFKRHKGSVTRSEVRMLTARYEHTRKG